MSKAVELYVGARVLMTYGPAVVVELGRHGVTELGDEAIHLVGSRIELVARVGLLTRLLVLGAVGLGVGVVAGAVNGSNQCLGQTRVSKTRAQLGFGHFRLVATGPSKTR